MVIYGIAIDTRYSNSGELEVKTRIPNVHGPMSETEYQGAQVTNYTREADLPWYKSILLPNLPNYGEIVLLDSVNGANNEWVVLGVTGGTYKQTIG